MSIFKKRLTFYLYKYIIICACDNATKQYRDVAQFGSLEFDRVLWTKKGKRKGAAVEKIRRSKTKIFSGTARVSEVAARADCLINLK